MKINSIIVSLKKLDFILFLPFILLSKTILLFENTKNSLKDIESKVAYYLIIFKSNSNRVLNQSIIFLKINSDYSLNHKFILLKFRAIEYSQITSAFVYIKSKPSYYKNHIILSLFLLVYQFSEAQTLPIAQDDNYFIETNTTLNVWFPRILHTVSDEVFTDSAIQFLTEERLNGLLEN